MNETKVIHFSTVYRRFLLGNLIVLMLLDGITTHIGLKMPGIVESNPIINMVITQTNPVVAVVATTVLGILSVIVYEGVVTKRQDGCSYIVSVISSLVLTFLTIIYLAVVINNITLIT